MRLEDVGSIDVIGYLDCSLLPVVFVSNLAKDF